MTRNTPRPRGKRQPGRPPIMEGAEVIAGHLPREMAVALRARCMTLRITRAEALRQAVAMWLA